MGCFQWALELGKWCISAGNYVAFFHFSDVTVHSVDMVLVRVRVVKYRRICLYSWMLHDHEN